MKILSWNIKRPKIGEKRSEEIKKIINYFDADLIFLTETNSAINFLNFNKIETKEFPKLYNGIEFNSGENKTTIFSKYKIKKIIKTYDEFSSVCAEIESELGNIIIYGSIIGFTGGRNEFFEKDFVQQKIDLKNLNKESNLCFSGDLNISFSGYPYPSKKVQNEMLKFCESLNLEILTKDIQNSAIHIILSKEFLENKSVNISEKQIENRISDHNLIFAEISN